MADRRVRVILEAVTAQYAQGMARARQETTGLADSARKNSAEFTRLGLAMAAAGAAIGLGLRKAGREAIQFESALTKSVTLIGISREEMQGMGDAALRMSDTGRGPLELADALFFVQSAGLRGSAAMDVLEASAKASAIGLGETKVVADLASSAMNAYGADVLSATEATDILVGTVREGKAEAPELAAAMGKVLPIASEMGVRFDEVGAAVAAMTRTGTDASTATTQLRSILQSLIKPAQQSEQALNEIGLSSAQLRDTIQRDGLWAAMMQLRQAIGDNDEALGRILPNQRALLGFLDLTGANAEENAGIFERLTQTMGLTEQAHEEWSKTAEAAIARFSAASESARISAMEGLAAPLSLVLDIGTRLMQMYVDLPGPVRKAGTIFAGAAAAVGTLGGAFLILLPRILATKAALAAMPPVIGRTVGLLGKAGLAGALIGVGVFAFDAFTQSTKFANVALGEFRGELLNLRRTGEVSDTIDQARDALERFDGTVKILGLRMSTDWGTGIGAGTRASNDLQEAIKLLDMAMSDLVTGGDIQTTGDLVAFVADAMDVSSDRARELVDDMPHARDALANVGDAADDAGSAADGLGDDLDALGDEFLDVADDANQAADAIDSWQDALRAATDPVFALQKRLTEYQSAQEAANKAVKKYGKDSDEAKEAQWALFEAASALFAEVNSGAASFDEAAAAIDAMRDAGLLTKAEAKELKAEVKELTDAAEGYEGDYRAELKAELDRPSLTAAEAELVHIARLRTPEYQAELSRRHLGDVRKPLDEAASVRRPQYRPQVDRPARSVTNRSLNDIAQRRRPQYSPLRDTAAGVRVNTWLNHLARIRTATIRVRTTGTTGGSLGNLPIPIHTGGRIVPGGVRRFHDGGHVSADHRPRFHSGVDRLRADEVPAVLQTGETVLSRRQAPMLDRMLASATALSRMMGNTSAVPGPGFHDGGLVGSSSGGGRMPPLQVELLFAGSGGLMDAVQRGVNNGEIRLTVNGTPVRAG